MPPEPITRTTLFDRACTLVRREAETLNSNLTIVLSCDQEPQAAEALLRCAERVRNLQQQMVSMGGTI